MTEVISPGTVLSDSTFRTRPHFSTYLQTDANALGNSVQQIEDRRIKRQMKFPTLSGRKDVDSFQDKNSPAFIRWNTVGDFRSEAPFRSFDNIVDPVSGFVSAGGDVDRNTSHTRIRSLVQLSDTPQSNAPQAQSSIRVRATHAPPELQRSGENDSGTPYLWNSRKVLDGTIRGKLGGWTSAKDPRKTEENEVTRDEASQLRDRLALRYVYNPSTQRSYEQVPWDNMLAPRRFPPTCTVENKPDMISQRWTLKRYDPAACEWQATGRAWDWFQPRRGHYKNGAIVFCSPCPRAQQIPLYSGEIGAENLDEIDNAQVPFRPFTVKRVNIPRYVETAHRPNIPNYTGCTLYRSENIPRPFTAPELSAEHQTTTHVQHQPMPIEPNNSEFSRTSQMSKMVTLVPPCNPFNNIKREQIQLGKKNENGKDPQTPPGQEGSKEKEKA